MEVYDDVGMEPREFTPIGDSVVVAVHHTLRSKAGVELDLDMHHVWTLRDGRVVYVTGYRDRAKAHEHAACTSADE